MMTVDQDAEWKARHEDNLPAFTADLRALCEKYGFKLIAQGYEGGAELSVDHGWPLAKSDRFSSYAIFPDE